VLISSSVTAFVTIASFEAQVSRASAAA